MRFIEETEAAWSAEQLAAAEREIEERKLEWERNRLAAIKEEEERRARELEEENELLTFSREDATNQVSTKSKKVNRDRVCTPSTVKRVNRRSSNKFSNKVDKIDKSNSRRHYYSTRRSVSRMSMVNKTKIDNEDEVEETTNDSKSSVDDLKSEIDQSAEEDSKVANDNNSEHFDDDEGSLDSEGESYKPSNHVDHNSPRTRSRGTVAIDLWTLDVNPLLPGVKPVKSSTPVNSRRRGKVRKESDTKTEKNVKKSIQNDNEKVADNTKGEKKLKNEMESEIKDKCIKKIKIDNESENDSNVKRSPRRIKPVNVEVHKKVKITNEDADNFLKSSKTAEFAPKDADINDIQHQNTINDDLSCPESLNKVSAVPKVDRNDVDSNDLKCVKRKLKHDECVESEDSSKKLKKKNGNKDVELQENIEKMMHDGSGGDEQVNKTDEMVLATIADVIEESDKNGKIGIDHNNKSLSQKTLKVLLSTRDIDKYLVTKDDSLENCDIDIQNTPLGNHDVNTDMPQCLQHKSVTDMSVKNQRTSSPKSVKKNIDLKNSTLDGWLLKSSPRANSESSPLPQEVDNCNSLNDVLSEKVENTVLCESDRTSSNLCDERNDSEGK